jgi:predicted  nucleic acid-binding Zn-ribbon protein
MPAFVLLSSAFLVFAVTVQLIAFQYQPAALVELFWSLPVSQQIAWVIICLVPLSLIAVVLLQYSRLIEKGKAAEVLETRLRSIRLDVHGLEEEQKNNEQAIQYLHRSDPEGAISALRGRIDGTEQAVQFQQERNQSGDLTGALEQVRQQQQVIRQKLGDVIAKRRSIETSIAQLQTFQDDIDQSISFIEQDKDGETLQRRLQKLSQFIGMTNTRCDEIECSMPGLLELEDKFEALQRRLAPLEQKKTGVIGTLKALSDVRNQIDAAIARLERDDEGIGLEDRLGEAQRLSQFIEAASTRCEEIERLMPGLLEMEDKFQALQRRLAPLGQKKTGVIGTLKALSDDQSQLNATIARLEVDEGVGLEERTQQLTKTKHDLEERVSNVLMQFSEIEAMHKDITDLFGKLNQARRMPREFDPSTRVVSINGNGADRRQGETGEPSVM